MHQAIENFLERPTSHKAAAWVGCLLLLVGGFWYLFYSASSEKYEELSQKVDELETSVTTEKRLASRLKQAKDKLEELNGKLASAIEELPNQSEVDDLLERSSNLGREAGLEMNLFQRREEVYREFYAEVPVSVSVTGTYHQVATFFDEVGRLPRIINISNINIVDPKVGDESVTVKVECTLTAFRYLSEQERAQRAPEKKGRK